MQNGHGHMWYCFGCEGRKGQDHRSFDSDEAMLNHLRTKHPDVVQDINVLPRSERF